METDLEEEYQKDISKGVWEATQFLSICNPVAPNKKALQKGQKKPKIRVCGIYSVTFNSQQEDHQHPLPLPEDLMRRLEGHRRTIWIHENRIGRRIQPNQACSREPKKTSG